MKKVKTITISILFSILTISTFGQDYFPFPSDSATWYSMYSWPEMIPPYVSYYTIKYEAIGDTLINDLTYTKLYSEFIYDTKSTNYEGAYRIDTDDECVYFIDNYDNTESLLYDFKLIPGDTIIISGSNYEPYSLVCLDTSSILINGTPHKTYSIHSYLSNGTSCYTQWVKGLGSLRMPIETDVFCGASFEWVYDLTCFYYKDLKMYEWEMNPYFTGCYGHDIVGIEEHPIENLQVVPNPVVDLSKLLGYKNDHQKINYQLLDITGRIIYEQNNTQHSEIVINKSNYTSGIYFLRVYSNDLQEVEVLKFLIK